MGTGKGNRVRCPACNRMGSGLLGGYCQPCHSRQNNWQPPSNWTRELILDPGTSKPAVLFVAIPPPTLGEYYVVYDELYPGRADADQLAKMIKVKMQGYPFYRFIIDQRAGKQTPMGFKISIAENYARAFEENNISPVS